MASLLETIFEDDSLAQRLAIEAAGSQTLALTPNFGVGVNGVGGASDPRGDRVLEGFVPRRRVLMFGNWGSESLPDSVTSASAIITPSGEVSTSTIDGRSGEPAAEYRLIGRLGSGGTAVVYQAHQRAIDREVAIKMLREEFAEDHLARLRFLTEARVIGSLDHPNVIALHDLCVDENDQLFYSMKRIDGTSWNHQIADRSVEENLSILLRVADAIRYSHSRGLVHRDLKPDNVMLGRFGEALVADWGLAIRIEDIADFRAHPTHHRGSFPVGNATAIGGTPAYMAPEQAMGDLRSISPRTDIYLLGAILFQILTGRPPHHGKNLLECIHAAANNVIQKTDVKGELLDAAYRAMATDPGDRFASVEEMISAITDHRTHQESERLVRRASRRVWAEPTSEPAVDPYERFRVGEALLHESLALWPDNPLAISTLQRTQLEFARFAASQGDLDLSMRLYEVSGKSDCEAATRVRRDLERRQRVRESQAKYSALFTQSPEAGLLIRWKDGIVMEANQACLRLLGYEKNELVGNRIAELSIWACAQRQKDFVELVANDGQVDNFETQFVHKNAVGDCDSVEQMAASPETSHTRFPGVFDVLISARTVEVGGEAMLLSTIRDITIRRQTERSLEQSRRRLRDLQQLAGLGTWSYDPVAHAVHWSPETFRVSGRCESKGEPNMDEFRDLIHPDDRDSVDRAIRMAMENGASYQLTFRQRDDQGEYRKLFARGQPVGDAEGKTVEVYGILQIANS